MFLRLQLHLPVMHMVVFDPTDNASNMDTMFSKFKTICDYEGINFDKKSMCTLFSTYGNFAIETK